MTEHATSLRPFEALGERLDAEWRRLDYRAAAFPELACRALEEADLPVAVDYLSPIEWLASTPTVPQQEDLGASFGQPPITLFRTSRFFVSVLYWLDGTTSVHQHAFSGAFQVFHGSSFHGAYSFDQHGDAGERLAFGSLALTRMQLLAKGAVRPIEAGPDFIHSLFHLDRPSASLVVRTYQEPDALPQFDYRRPGVAIDPFYSDDLLKRRLQAALLLTLSDPHGCEPTLGAFLDASDSLGCFRLLETIHGALGRDELARRFGLEPAREIFDRLVARARSAHGAVFDMLPAMLDEEARDRDLITRRASIVDPDHRFFLAVLLNAADLATARELVAERYPEADAIETMLEWIEQLASSRVLDAAEPNVLGIAIADDDLLALDALLTTGSRAGARACVAAEYPPDLAARIVSSLDTTADRLAASILRPIIPAAGAHA